MSPIDAAPGAGRKTALAGGAAALLALAGVALWLWSLSSDPAQGWRALLVNFLFFTSLAGGLVAWSPIVLLSHGKWAGSAERFTAAGMSFALPSLVALALLWYGGTEWAPWYAKELHQGKWLSPPRLFGRDLVLLALYWGVARYYLRRRRLGKGEVVAAWTVIAYCFVFSIIGFDLVMALDSEWYSAAFGAYFFVSGLYIAACAWALLVVLLEKKDEERLHDLGKLIFAFSILTTYLMFSQLLPIWYENLPKEIHYVAPRVNFQPWSAVSWGILAVAWLGPLLLLLTIRAKKTAWILAPVALLLMLAMWVERWWLVAPTFQKELSLGLAELSMFCVHLGVLACGICWSLRRGHREFPQGGE